MGNLAFTNDIECQKYIPDTGCRHHFSFTELLHGDAFCTQSDLYFCKSNKLMGLYMRAVGDAALIALFLPTRQITKCNININ